MPDSPPTTRTGTRAALLALVLAAACHDSGGGGGGPLRNLRVGAHALHGGGAMWVVEVSEADQGATDLNGDGDALDDVAFAYRASDGALRNLGVALAHPLGGGVTPAVVGDVLVALLVSEAAQGGADLNGDGDALDVVLFVYDDNSGAVTGTQLAAAPIAPAVGGASVAFAVSEGAQGGTDLDGDGMVLGNVLHVYDARTGFATNAMRNVTSDVVFHDHAFAITTDEPSSDADLNADGDKTDAHVFEMYDLLLGGVEQVPLAVRPNPLAVNADDWFLLADEAEEGMDLNADGDLLDGVLFEVHPHQGTRQMLPFSASLLTGTTSGTLVAFLAREIDGFDRNGDGDLLDAIAIVYDQVSMQAWTGLAVGTTAPLAFVDAQLGFLAHESDSGLDLNLDGDELDDVLHVLDGTDGGIENTLLDAVELQAGAGRFVLARPEATTGVDYNGDGDVLDTVLFHLDPLTGAQGSTGLGGQAFADAVAGRWILARAYESAEGRDLNGDGDELDTVYFAHDMTSGTNTVLGVAGPSGGADLGADGRGLILVWEDGVDLNGDGDGDDSVLHALTLR